MTLEDLKKHVRPLVWVEFGKNLAAPKDHVVMHDFIHKNRNGTWYSSFDGKNYSTKEEAMQSVEELHIRELAKFFELEEPTT